MQLFSHSTGPSLATVPQKGRHPWLPGNVSPRYCARVGRGTLLSQVGEAAPQRVVGSNGDNIINDDDRYIKEDPFADIIMGLTNSIRYKDWDFSVTARASIGNYAYNNLASNAVFNAAASINNILNNIHSDYLSTGFVDFTENSLLSDHYIQEASFVKIDNISIGYNMTTNSGCKIRFFGSLQNVATFTDYEGIDPEIYGGIDNNFYPRPQTGVFGVTFEF